MTLDETHKPIPAVLSERNPGQARHFNANHHRREAGDGNHGLLNKKIKIVTDKGDADSVVINMPPIVSSNRPNVYDIAKRRVHNNFVPSHRLQNRVMSFGDVYLMKRPTMACVRKSYIHGMPNVRPRQNINSSGDDRRLHFIPKIDMRLIFGKQSKTLIKFRPRHPKCIQEHYWCWYINERLQMELLSQSYLKPDKNGRKWIPLVSLKTYPYKFISPIFRFYPNRQRGNKVGRKKKLDLRYLDPQIISGRPRFIPELYRYCYIDLTIDLEPECRYCEKLQSAAYCMKNQQSIKRHVTKLHHKLDKKVEFRRFNNESSRWSDELEACNKQPPLDGIINYRSCAFFALFNIQLKTACLGKSIVLY